MLTQKKTFSTLQIAQFAQIYYMLTPVIKNCSCELRHVTTLTLPV